MSFSMPLSEDRQDEQTLAALAYAAVQKWTSGRSSFAITGLSLTAGKVRAAARVRGFF